MAKKQTKTEAQNEMTDAEVDERQLEKDVLLETGSVMKTRGKHGIHCLTIIGQVEGHTLAPQSQKTTKYEHIIPQIISIQEDPEIEGLLVVLNTVGGDVEAGLAIAELISGINKPSASLVLGGGHSRHSACGFGRPQFYCAHCNHDSTPGTPFRHDAWGAPDDELL